MPHAVVFDPPRTACFFHVFFKASAITLYVLAFGLFNNFIVGFVTCVLLLAFDFWTVKNVTGRLLVGLRWWNEVREDGSNVWIFESKPGHPSGPTRRTASGSGPHCGPLP